jgi:hypothetical protein
MTNSFQYRRSLLVVAVVAVTVFFLTQCISNEQANTKPGAGTAIESYAGSEKCASCHQDIYKKHLQTAHYLTSQPAAKQSIKGSFEKDSNNYWYTPSLLLAMEKRDSGFYQVVYFKEEEKMAMRFDITIGSGIMGQSYLNWRGNHLFQMPITYFTAARQWSNSPGFPKEKVLTDRPVTSRCLECHATFAQGEGGTAMEPASFSKDKIIFGVGCENCHGPAAMHVDYQTKHPEEKTAKYIVNPSSLSRQLQLDVCALCHGGKIQKTQPSFTFTAGKKLSDYFTSMTISQTAMSSGEVEIHGNQYGLLQASKCFKQSSITCNNCHNTHENERGNMALFSSRCITCHNIKGNGFKTGTHNQVVNIEQNCIDCHMPQQESKAIAVFLQGENKLHASLIRSHYIGIYEKYKISSKK